MKYRFDAMLEGSEAEKNAALAPALAVPDIDKEVLLAQGKRIGMAPSTLDQPAPVAEEPPTKTESTPASSVEIRRPSQDEIMGYHDDDDDYPDDDEPAYM